MSLYVSFPTNQFSQSFTLAFLSNVAKIVELITFLPLKFSQKMLQQNSDKVTHACGAYHNADEVRKIANWANIWQCLRNDTRL